MVVFSLSLGRKRRSSYEPERTEARPAKSGRPARGTRWPAMRRRTTQAGPAGPAAGTRRPARWPAEAWARRPTDSALISLVLRRDASGVGLVRTPPAAFAHTPRIAIGKTSFTNKGRVN